MVQPTVLLGLDLGTTKIGAVVAVVEENAPLNVTGAGLANPQGGIRCGEITDLSLARQAIERAVGEAMRMAGQTRVDGIRVSVGGNQFRGENLRDSITIASPNRVITVGDRDRALQQASSGLKLAKEERVLHHLPQMFHIKGQRDIRNPVDLVGDTLEAEVRIIFAPTAVLDNIERALQMSGLQGAELMYSPLASAEAVLSREDAENGAVVVDIGDQLTHMGVFLHGALFHSAVVPIGGTHFTKDLEITKHLGGISVAERIKKRHGTALPSHIPAEEMVELEDEGRQVSIRELSEVLHARGIELLNMVLAEIGRSGLIHEIHGGVHMVGGGSLLRLMPNLAQTILGRPRVLIGKPIDIQGLAQVTANPMYTNALGAVKHLYKELHDTSAKSGRGRGLWERFKELF